MKNIILLPFEGIKIDNIYINFGIEKDILIKLLGLKPDLDEGGHLRFFQYGAFDFKDNKLSNIEIYIDNIGEENVVSFKDLCFYQYADFVLNWFSDNNYEYRKNDPELGYSYIFNDLELSLWRPCKPEDVEEDLGENEYQKGLKFSTVGIGIKGTWSEYEF